MAISLASQKSSDLARLYEVGNVLSRFYTSKNIPAAEFLLNDLEALLNVYRALVDRELILSEPLDPQETELYKDAVQIGLHKRIERNQSLAKEVKRRKGDTCEACGFNFFNRFGETGRGYIEAHHLTPISALHGSNMGLNPEKDFAVLCANCQRMIHKTPWIGDIVAFKRHFSL
jgi:5-methylcytosine-specific restriction protein A